MLTDREIKIGIKFLESKEPIKIKDLAKELEVSTRTIKYNLDNLKCWFKEHHVDVVSQPNKGIWLECNEDKRIQTLKEIIEDGRKQQVPDQNFRMKKILIALLLHNDYITAADLAEELQVSRNTILNDMNLVDEYIEAWMIKLERAKRSGYKLIGEELHLRLLLENLIYSYITNFDIYQIMTRIISHKQDLESEFLIESGLHPVYTVAEKHLSDLYVPSVTNLFQQSDLLSLLIRITVSITRLNMGNAIKGYRVLNKRNYTDPVSTFIFTFMEGVFGELELPLLENEFLYLSGETDKGKKGIDLIQATNGIIEMVSEKEGIDYRRDQKLFSNLFAHLSLRLQRGMFNIVETNPFVDEIKHKNYELFKSILEACQVHLGLSMIVNQDAFISLIALHFLTSFENTFSKRIKVRALYVCSTGRGVARLIKSRVEKEIHDIEMVTYCSIMEVEELCQKEKVDLIISVFPIQAEVPVIVVDAIPSSRDIEGIKVKVDDIMKKNPKYHLNLRFEDQGLLNENSEQISQDIIVKGFEVLHEILSAFKEDLEETRIQALQLHIFLMVHRSYFDKQYDDFLYSNHPLSEKNKQDLRVIEEILKNMDLDVHQSELIALLQYFK